MCATSPNMTKMEFYLRTIQPERIEIHMPHADVPPNKFYILSDMKRVQTRRQMGFAALPLP